MNRVRQIVVWAVCTMLVAGNSLLAAEQSQQQAVGRIRDIALPKGTLQGVVVDRQAVPVAGRRIQLYSGTSRVAEVVTDSAGCFQVQGLRNGLHGVRVGNSGTAVRFWDSQRAPQTAAKQLVLVLDQGVLRGQSGDDGCGEVCAEGCGEGCGEGCVTGSAAGRRNLAVAALLLAAGGTAAVIAISQNDDDAPASP